ncbi:hypothetical protein D5F01_LYC13010 [Larimichthys crocea]|uniref:Testis development-related protein n=2 Tax=Larimichthys crocea TaxID=215358 RepID=A0A6G0ICH3_LARCR|nr:hypothetical protein D5F01_LYC13010 [Larimichthys crocea]TMS10580.1 Uncharacterized protein E3U43_019573 [Larimichthys crocea]
MNPMWKVYTNKVLKTLNPEYEEDTAEEVTEVESDMMSPVQEDAGPNAVSQLARKMQGAGTKSWNKLSALFNKDDEHQLLEETESPPVADHPLAVKPEEPPPRPPKRSGFWDTFATNFAAKKQAEAAAAAAAAHQAAEAGQGEEGVTEAVGEVTQDGQVTEGGQSDGGGGRSNNSFSKYVSLGGGNQDASFKWNFVTSKLAELKTKTN